MTTTTGKPTHQVRFMWDNGVRDVTPCWSLGEAQAKRAELQHLADMQDRSVDVAIETYEP